MVDDADRAIGDVERAFSELGLEVFEVDEHDVDYDEAFVRVVQRHRTSIRDHGAADESPDPERGDPNLPASGSANPYTGFEPSEEGA